jgi:hypothetical protein
LPTPERPLVPAEPDRETASPKGALASWRRHLIYFLLSAAVIAAAFCLQVLPDGDRVSIREASEAKLPPLCISRYLLGLKCPGCGLTRSFIHLAHGDVAASVRAHRVGWLLFAVIAAQIPYRAYAMRWPPKGKAAARFSTWVCWVLVVLLLANWAGEMLLARWLA